MFKKIKAFIAACFDGVAVVILVTGATLIVAIHAILLHFNWYILAVYLAIALVALIAGWIRIWGVYKRKMAREALTDLLDRGRKIQVDINLPLNNEIDHMTSDWENDVEKMLTKHLDRSYIFRFRVQLMEKMFQGPSPQMIQLLEIQSRLRRLEEFLVELNDD